MELSQPPQRRAVERSTVLKIARLRKCHRPQGYRSVGFFPPLFFSLLPFDFVTGRAVIDHEGRCDFRRGSHALHYPVGSARDVQRSQEPYSACVHTFDAFCVNMRNLFSGYHPPLRHASSREVMITERKISGLCTGAA